MGQHANDLRAGAKIDEWNRSHHVVFDRTNDALDDFEKAIGNYQNNGELRQLRAAGQRLADQMRSLQNAPMSGVPQYDGPRIEAMALYEQAGEAAVEINPDDGDQRTLEVAALLVRGRETMHAATQYTTDLIARLTARAPRDR